ncbi:pH-response transcription factor pacC/RIM101 [Coccidioides immitis RMSCC 3703]|uniref:pH-response transcription factor pacC/RIM101 n=1 Tax=Coccidioides immitis RMSCC 3703 TaxID=454286 RepID=A0A0J8R3R2_COCIT|nr:pH-response transcription factor pacC/RIM101 [Coccidioides immitis RMSCC 3703]
MASTENQDSSAAMAQQQQQQQSAQPAPATQQQAQPPVQPQQIQAPQQQQQQQPPVQQQPQQQPQQQQPPPPQPPQQQQAPPQQQQPVAQIQSPQQPVQQSIASAPATAQQAVAVAAAASAVPVATAQDANNNNPNQQQPDLTCQWTGCREICPTPEALYFLEQMQTTVYESDENVAAAGVAQPGAHYIHGALSYRTTNSPPTAPQLPSSHATATATATSAPPATSSASARSPHSATPALTPPSSAQSYTSGRSPVSLSSSHHIPPSSHQAHPQTSSSMYPTLPTTSAQESAPAGYPSVSSVAPPSTLSSIFENDDRRRYTGGMLQRARMDYPEPMDVSMDGSSDPNPKNASCTTTTTNAATTTATTTGEQDKISDNMIDPFLRRGSTDRQASTAHNDTAKRRSATGSPDTRGATPKASSSSRTAEEMWVENVRLLQRLRDYIHERLYHGDYEEGVAVEGGGGGSGHQSASYGHQGLSHSEMQGMEAIAAAAVADRDEEIKDEGGDEVKADSLYPVLKMDGEEDKMKMDES